MPRGLRAKVPMHVREALKEQAVRGKVKEPDLAKLVHHFFDICGGERSVASLLYGEFTAAAEGSQTRQRIMDLILRCLAKTSENKKEEDLEGLTEEQLAQQLEDLIGDAIDASSAAAVESVEEAAGEDVPGDEPACADGAGI